MASALACAGGHGLADRPLILPSKRLSRPCICREERPRPSRGPTVDGARVRGRQVHGPPHGFCHRLL